MIAMSTAPTRATCTPVDSQRRAGAFACSDPLLQEIHDTVAWTFECLSLGGYVVDCAQRERMGYGGDAHATIETALEDVIAAAAIKKCAEGEEGKKLLSDSYKKAQALGISGSPNWLLNNRAIGWPWRFLKANARDYRKSELFGNLHRAFPSDMPILTAHMWNCMGAVAGGMTNVVDMMFDNWPMAFQLTEGATHAVQSPSGYYGFRIMNQFDEQDRILEPTPADAIEYVGHHVDHELVENIEVDCAARVTRMNRGEPRRFVLTMGGAGAQRELFKAIIDHSRPMIERGEMTLFVNLGDHESNWDWLKGELGSAAKDVTLHRTWEEAKAFTDDIREGEASGLHVFIFDNTFHGVYATNYLMRVTDVMITKPSELAFYPIPKIFNERVGAHEAWGAIRSAELGDGTIETRTVPRTLQAIDLMTKDKIGILYDYFPCIGNIVSHSSRQCLQI